jgi:hypothetical protein
MRPDQQLYSTEHRAHQAVLSTPEDDELKIDVRGDLAGILTIALGLAVVLSPLLERPPIGE